MRSPPITSQLEGTFETVPLRVAVTYSLTGCLGSTWNTYDDALKDDHMRNVWRECWSEEKSVCGAA